MYEHHKLEISKMRSEYLGQIQQSTTLFPQRRCNNPLESRKDPSLAEIDLHLKSDSDPLKNDSNKENEKGVLKEIPEIAIKSEISDDICENTHGRNSYVAVPTGTELIMCFVCDKEIVYEYLSEHLLLGHVKCMRCSVVFTNCKYFQEWTVERDIGMSVCNHMLQYLNNPWETLNDYHSKGITNISPSIAEERKNKVHNYLELIKSLQNRYPWKEIFSLSDKYRSKFIEVPKENVALDFSFDKFTSEAPVGDSNPRECCGAQISQENQTLESNSCEIDVLNNVIIPVSEKNDQESIRNDNYKTTNNGLTKKFLSLKKNCNGIKKSSDQFLKVKKRKVDLNDTESKRKVLVSQTRKSTKYIETPSDGFYYIAKDSVKECPNCYTVIKPEDFSVNIVTFLMTAICSDCGLTIYVVDEPSLDDERPRICIVTEQKSAVKKH